MKHDRYYAAIRAAQTDAVSDINEIVVHPIFGNADAGDIADCLDDISRAQQAFMRYASARMAYLNDNLPGTARLPAADYLNLITDAFAELRGGAMRTVKEMAEDAEQSHFAIWN